MKALILAGGRGTRLWPISRNSFPKQFQKIASDKTLLEELVERISGVEYFVSTNMEFKLLVKDILKVDDERIIVEPAFKNTAPAVAYAMQYLVEKEFVDEDEAVVVLPSDHYVKEKERFMEYLLTAEKLCRRHIVTFGIKPRKPETGYGYIKPGETMSIEGVEVTCVECFIEKPDEDTAKWLIESGAFWNSGIFMFTPKVFFRELKECSPEIYSKLRECFHETWKCFTDMPDISIDYAVIERSRNVVCLPMDISWSDLGSWDSLYEVVEKDENGNFVKGNAFPMDTKDCLIYSQDGRLVCVVGVDDLIVVESEDVALILKRGMGQRVKELVEKLRAMNRREVLEHVVEYRPWGYYKSLLHGDRYKIKKIVVYPSAKLSYQMHYHRSEHWVVVRGTAKVVINGREHVVREGESIFVPKAALHRLENPGKIDLEIVEIQQGEYLHEDDIIRVEDEYGRADAVGGKVVKGVVESVNGNGAERVEAVPEPKPTRVRSFRDDPDALHLR